MFKLTESLCVAFSCIPCCGKPSAPMIETIPALRFFTRRNRGRQCQQDSWAWRWLSWIPARKVAAQCVRRFIRVRARAPGVGVRLAQAYGGHLACPRLLQAAREQASMMEPHPGVPLASNQLYRLRAVWFPPSQQMAAKCVHRFIRVCARAPRVGVRPAQAYGGHLPCLRLLQAPREQASVMERLPGVPLASSQL